MANSRRKGKDGENEVALLLRRVFPGVKRNLTQYQGSSGRDFTGTEPWVVQVKRLARRPAVEAMLAEAEREVVPFNGELAVLLVRGDRGEWLAVLLAEDWLGLVEAIWPPSPGVEA